MTFQASERDKGKQKLQLSGILLGDECSTIHKSLILRLLPKKFRRRFRIPFALFHEWLVPICREKNLFGAAQSPIPLEFKVLVTLRILGRNNTADDTNELSRGSIGESSCNEIFKTFVVNFAKECYHESFREPEGEDLLKVRNVSVTWISWSHREYGLHPCPLGAMSP